LNYQTILVERLAGGVGLIRLNRPKVLNALSQGVMNELVEAARDLDRDPAIGAIVLTGDERAFAAGADIAELAGMSVPELLGGYRFEQWEALYKTSKPLIGAVSGFALGGGCELAMVCDLIIASETARFGQPEINLGVMPGAGGTQRLVRAVGKSLAMEMVLNGRVLDAGEALRHGLVARVVPVELYLEEAVELARQLSARAPVAVKLAKQAVLRAFETTLTPGLEFERHNFYLLFGTVDQDEGMKAFLEKRPPEWKGR